MALAARSHLGMASILVPQQLEAVGTLGTPQSPLQVPDASDWTAATLRVQGMTLMSVVCYMDHSTGPGGANAIKLRGIGSLVQRMGLPFVIGGDWNMTCEELQGSGWVRELGATVSLAAAAESTCTSGAGRVLDYFVVSYNVSSLIRSNKVVPEAPFKPHTALNLQMHGRPREIQGLVLKKGQAHPPSHGPRL